MSDATPWAADTPISIPQPIEVIESQRVEMGGFVFTPSGLRHNLTEADLDNTYTPTYAPPETG